MKKLLSKIIIYTAIFVSLIFILVRAGSLNPDYSTDTATNYTLADINNFITNNTTAVEGEHTVSTSLSPNNPSLASLEEIYAKPSKFD